MEKSIGGITVNDIATTDEIIFAPISKSFQMPVCNKSVITEITEEITLPDYQPEIRRLLRITPNIPIPSQYVGGNAAEFSGNIEWNILYVCGDGTLSEASFSSPYEVFAEFDESISESIIGEYFASIETTPENVSAKVTAPRKLNIKCRLAHKIKAFGDIIESLATVDTESAEHIKKLSKALPSLKLVSGVDNTVELSEGFSFADGEKLISKRGEVIINSAEPSNQGITCKGSVCFKLLTQRADKSTSVAERTVPFTAYVPIDLDGDAWNCRAYGKLDDINTEDTETGTDLRARISVFAEALRNQPSEITTDIFSTDFITDTEFDQLSLPFSISSGIYDLSQEGSANMDDLPDGATAIDVLATARAENMVLENGQYILLGKCKYSVLYGSENEYSVRESEFPFSFELGSGTEAPKDFFADICVRSAKVRPEGENMAFSAELTAAVDIIGETPVTAVTGFTFGDELLPRSSAFTVAYTGDGDTLWNISKKYAVDPALLAKANGIKYSAKADDKETLSGIKYLII